MRGTESIKASNIAATTAAFGLNGGRYGLGVVATFGGGNVTIQILGPDGTTWLTAATAVSAAGFSTMDLPPGQYRFAITTATAVYISLTRIPGE